MGTGGLKTNYAMAESMEKSKIANLNLAVVLSFSAVLLMGTLLGGCSTVSPWARARRLSYERKLSSPYDRWSASGGLEESPSRTGHGGG